MKKIIIAIHLKNRLALDQAGALILPANQLGFEHELTSTYQPS